MASLRKTLDFSKCARDSSRTCGSIEKARELEKKLRTSGGAIINDTLDDVGFLGMWKSACLRHGEDM